MCQGLAKEVEVIENANFWIKKLYFIKSQDNQTEDIDTIA